MDDDQGLDISPEEIQSMSMQDRKQLETELVAEKQKMSVQKSVHDLAETCFKRCITASISSGKLASKEESCMQNCVERFMDSNLAVLRHLETLRSQQ